MKKNLKYNILVLNGLFVALFALLMGGCGGGSSGGGQSSAPATTAKATAAGRASVTIKWPARTTKSAMIKSLAQATKSVTIKSLARTTKPTRLVPVASNSIVVSISYNGSLIASQTVARPADGSASTVTFSTLPVGNLSVSAEAFPNADGTGNAQASAIGVLQVIANQTAPLQITMNSTIASLAVSPSSLGTLPINGTPVAFSVEALDATNVPVLVSTQTIFWFTDNPAVLDVTQDANDTGATVVGLASGDANLYAYEFESGVFTSIPVSVRGPLSKLQITAVTPQLSMGAYMQLSIVATDASNNTITAPTGLTWSSSNSQVLAVAASSGLCLGTVNPSVTTAQTAVVTVSASGISATTTVTVNPGPGTGSFLSPSAVTVNRSTSQQFLINTGTIIASNVTWSLLDPNNLGGLQGSIDGNGVYTAPPTPPMVNGLPVQITVQGVSATTTLTGTIIVQ